jgi:hypothetical protein
MRMHCTIEQVYLHLGHTTAHNLAVDWRVAKRKRTNILTAQNRYDTNSSKPSS